MDCSFEKIINERSDLHQYVYMHGFLMSDDKISEINEFPFYDNWIYTEVGDRYYIYSHPKTKVTVVSRDGIQFVMLGHAYDPYMRISDERNILNNLADAYSTSSYREAIDRITGLFLYVVVRENQVEFEVDATGLQLACYAQINNRFFLASHAQMFGDIFNLEMSTVVRRLVNYKWYYRMKGTYLPCDFTPYSEVLRIIPDIAYRFDGVKVEHERIFPIKELDIADSEDDYNSIIETGAAILKNSMEMIALKWKHPYISLTGGIDSNTAFAAANGLYDKFGCFTYVSAKKEEIDAVAAKKITDHFDVRHIRFDIPSNNEELSDFDALVTIMKHNSGYVTKRFDNEYRKRVFLIHNMSDIDVEVKSWSSEAIRGYFYNHFDRKKMPKCSPKIYRNLYKLFFFNRSLALDLDKAFTDYWKKYEYDRVPEALLYDLFYTEVSMGSWGAQNLAEMRMYSEVTSIFNNRKFLLLMLKTPLEKRIMSQNHLDMKKILNEQLYSLKIRVINENETRFRAKALNFIFNINNWLPF